MNPQEGAGELDDAHPVAGGDAGRQRMALVVVSYASHDLLAANLPLMPPGVIVVVVDNFHSVAERTSVTSLCRHRGWELVAMPGNPGFGAGCNAGIRRARELSCETFLLLNPDAQIDSATIVELHRHVVREPLTLVSPCVDDSSGRRVFQGVDLLLRNGRMRRHSVDAQFGDPRVVQLWLTGACLALHAQMVDRTGGLSESYFLYWEDVDLCLRAVRAGAKLVVRPDLRVVHDEGGTQERQAGTRAKTNLYYYYNCRNRLVLAALLMPRAAVLRWLITTPAASWEVLMRGGRRQLVHSRAPLWAALRGTTAGVVVAIAALVRRSPAATPVGTSV